MLFNINYTGNPGGGTAKKASGRGGRKAAPKKKAPARRGRKK